MADAEGRMSLLARIAELEVTRNELMATVEGLVEELGETEAELAELKARRCETCYVNMCGIQTAMQCDAGCNLWHARAEEGGGDE